ncbi:hypothetical protein [Hymenobacter psychrotolerans]|uniref:Immunity protein 50 n=1 Tax=Hymenobacter psychrotolerans DSM 18569 TaxID=1121959 RepID=A0A1M7HMZ2_9BACT|nr:hypothetical protein [Hymenobacter psychrotolerans]SHM29809.1 hypothetical protein SAMN02746009_04255 [Hymenobacter psychrotolerans DSM 18569]
MNNLPDFIAIYGDLHDALVEQVRTMYAPEGLTLQVTVQCMKQIDEGEWVFLDMTFEHVQEFRLPLDTRTQVIFELTAVVWGDKFVFDFLPRYIPPQGIDEHRESYFYLVCSAFDVRERSMTSI